jgi:hypothetical protein
VVMLIFLPLFAYTIVIARQRPVWHENKSVNINVLYFVSRVILILISHYEKNDTKLIVD